MTGDADRPVEHPPHDEDQATTASPVDAPRTEEAAADDVPAAEVPAGEVPAEEVPAGEAADVDVPTEGALAEEAPAEEGSGRGSGQDDAADEGPAAPRRRKRDPLASALIGVLTLLLGFAIAVQVRSTDEGQGLQSAREEDLVRILDELNAREDRLRQQIADQRAALEQLTNTDSQSATALEEAQGRAEAIGILNGTLPARGPGLVITIRDPEGEVRVADLLDAIQELRGAGAETMQIDGVRVGVSTAVTGEPGALSVDGQKVTAPYEIKVIGSPQNMETALNIPGGVVPRVNGRGGSVSILQVQDVLVDALRPLDTPQYASPRTGG